MKIIIDNKILLNELGFFDDLNGHRFTSQKIKCSELIERFISRTKVFDWFHMGSSETPIQQTLKTLSQITSLSIPRTGHLGSWKEIAAGRSGGMNYDSIICQNSQLGYPLLYDLNMTEDLYLEKGDISYLPGSLISNGQRDELPLWSWNGNSFEKESRENPLFTPFLFTSFEDKLIPLVDFHRRNLDKVEQYNFHYLSSLLHKHESMIKQILIRLIEKNHDQFTRQNTLKLLFDETVSISGKLCKLPVLAEGKLFKIGETIYKNTEELVEASLTPIRAASQPEKLLEILNISPKNIPIFSSPLVILLMMMLNADRPDFNPDGYNTSQAFDLHFHWGALRMAGFPPQKKGYFSKNVRQFRKLYEEIFHSYSEADPFFYILLPASVFLLWPNSAYPEDIEYINELIKKIHEESDHLKFKPNLSKIAIDSAVSEWFKTRKKYLSRYFKNRFNPNIGIFNSEKMPGICKHIEPHGFGELSWLQASSTVGALNTLISL